MEGAFIGTMLSTTSGPAKVWPVLALEVGGAVGRHGHAKFYLGNGRIF